MFIALAQYALSPDVSSNLGKVMELMREAGRKSAQMIIFPELCLSPFFPQLSGQDASRYAMTIDDPSIRVIQDTCGKLRLAASPNVYLQEGDRRFDASLMIDAKGEIRGISKMVHIAQLPGFYEQDYYAPSDSGFLVYDTPLGSIGIVVCFDRHLPESFRTCSLRGASLILVPTANTMAEPRDVFECELRAAAFQNGVYIAMCNRVGTEGDAVFCGESMIVDPNGSLIAKRGATEELVFAEIDLSQATVTRSRRPYLSLRRPELYL
jgi:predicted amidohydrolase